MNIEKRVALLENRSHVNFAAISNKAMGLESGNVKIELSPAHGAIYFATNRKPLSECIHFDVYESDIKDVNSITFKDGREITGVVDSYTEDPTKVLSAVAIDEFVTQVDELEDKVKDHETRITTNTNKIADHETHITNNTDKIAEHEKRINQNAADIIDCITDIGNNRNRIDGVINKTEDHETRITQNTNKITNLENTKAEKTEVLPFDFIYPVGAIVTGYRPRIGTWTQICTYGSWTFENSKHVIYVVKTPASMVVSLCFRKPENVYYFMNFKKLTAKCKDATMFMFDFRFDRTEDDIIYGKMEENPRVNKESYSYAGGTVTLRTRINLNYGTSNKVSQTLHFRFMRNQLPDYDTITASTFGNYVSIDNYSYNKTADDSIYAYKRTA